MGVDVDAPAARDYGQETRDTLQAQLDLAPAKYQAEAQFAPLYQDLQLSLLGKAAPKLMDVYANTVAPRLSQLEAEATRSQREADLSAVKELGPQAMEALRQANPEQAQLLDLMTGQAMAGMQAGSRLTPEQMTGAQQSSRQAWADRGLLLSPGSGLDEVMTAQLAGNAEQDRRRAYAGNVMGLQKQTYGDPFQMVLGRPSNTASMAQGFGAQAQSFNPGQLFNPESQYASDLTASNRQQQLAARTASAANKSALIGAGISAAGQAASAM